MDDDLISQNTISHVTEHYSSSMIIDNYVFCSDF